MKLYTYWRSQASYRVRVALRLKGLVAETIALDLLKGEQFEHTYAALNPQMAVPTLLDGDGPPLMQSLAIIEYIEEKYPRPPLLPVDLRARAHVRALAQMVAVDAHPFIVPRVRKYLEAELHPWHGAHELATALARRRQPRNGGCAGAGCAHRALLLRRSSHHCRHLPRRASDQRQDAMRPRCRSISDFAAYSRCLHADRGICARAPAAAGRRASERADLNSLSPP